MTQTMVNCEQRQYTDKVIGDMQRIAAAGPRVLIPPHPAPPDFLQTIDRLAELFGMAPEAQHPALLGLLVAELERAGVTVPEVWRESLDEG